MWPSVGGYDAAKACVGYLQKVPNVAEYSIKLRRLGSPGQIPDGESNGEQWRVCSQFPRCGLSMQVLRTVELREMRLNDVQQALRSFRWYHGRNNDAMSLITALAGLRDASLAVIRAVVVRVSPGVSSVFKSSHQPNATIELI